MENQRIWDKVEKLTLLDGKTYTPEEIFAHPDFPWSKVLTVYLADVEKGVIGEISPFSNVRDAYEIDTSLSNDAALQEIIEKINNPTISTGGSAIVTKSDIQLLGQLLTEMNLNILEGNINA